MGLAGCGLEEQRIPGLDGPSEQAFSLQLLANPDVLTADGRSYSWIEAVVHDPNGQRWAEQEILFAVADESGNWADIGTLHNPAFGSFSEASRLHAGTATATTDGDGVARVVYRSPPRTDFTANSSILIVARPVGTDANAALYRQVRIELKSAEPRYFPQNPDNVTPVCNWAVEAPDGFRAGVVIHFQSTSYDEDGTIVRYEWDWDDGTRGDKPDEGHVFGWAGSYNVLHVVTDDDGAQAACSATVTIQ